MRCISRHAAYSIQVIETDERIVTDATGYAKRIPLKKGFVADFSPGGLLDYEQKVAFERIPFSGLPEGVNPLTTVGVYDSEADVIAKFPKHERSAVLVQVNQILREKQKDFPNDFIIVDPPEAPRPWTTYDEDSVEDILKFQERLKVDPDEIRLYEVQHQNRDEIVLAMLEQTDPEAAARRMSGVEDNEIPGLDEQQANLEQNDDDEVIEIGS